MLKIDREIAGRNSSLILRILVHCFKLSFLLEIVMTGLSLRVRGMPGHGGDLIPHLSSASPGPRVEDENATSSQFRVTRAGVHTRPFINVQCQIMEN